jgi:hypothetical protein
MNETLIIQLVIVAGNICTTLKKYHDYHGWIVGLHPFFDAENPYIIYIHIYIYKYIYTQYLPNPNGFKKPALSSPTALVVETDHARVLGLEPVELRPAATAWA